MVCELEVVARVLVLVPKERIDELVRLCRHADGTGPRCWKLSNRAGGLDISAESRKFGGST